MNLQKMSFMEEITALPPTPAPTVYPPPVIQNTPELTSVFLEKKGGLPQTQKEANLNKEWFEEVGPFIRSRAAKAQPCFTRKSRSHHNPVKLCDRLQKFRSQNMIQKEIDRKCWLPQIASFQASKQVAKIQKRAPKKPKKDPTGKEKSHGDKSQGVEVVFTGGEAGLSLIDGRNPDDIGAVPPNHPPPPPHSFVVEYLPDGSVAIKCESQISSQQQPPQPEVVVVEEVIEQDEGQVQDIEQTQPGGDREEEVGVEVESAGSSTMVGQFGSPKTTPPVMGGEGGSVAASTTVHNEFDDFLRTQDWTEPPTIHVQHTWMDQQAGLVTTATVAPPYDGLLTGPELCSGLWAVSPTWAGNSLSTFEDVLDI